MSLEFEMREMDAEVAALAHMKTPCSNVLASIRPALRVLKETMQLDPHQKSSYSPEILSYLLSAESAPPSTCLTTQPAITFTMRAVLVDWLVSIHLKFNLVQETLYLAVGLVDRYLEVKVISRAQLQLLGVAAMLVAAKYEEVYPPEVKEFVRVTDLAYTRKQVLEMEVDLLNSLEFRLTTPSTWHFLEHFSTVAGLTEKSQALAQYISELALVEYRMLRYKPSMQAAASVYIAGKVQRLESHWGAGMKEITGWSETQLKDCIRDDLVLFQLSQKHALSTVRIKYSRLENCEVARMQLL